MERRCIMIIVEGPNDQAFLRRVLAVNFNFEEFDGEESKLSELSPFWDHWKPNYPKVIKKSKKKLDPEIKTDLYARVDMPRILYRDSLSVGIFMGNGGELSNFLKDVDAALSNLPEEHFDLLEAICLFVDADQDDISLTFKRTIDWMRGIAENHFSEVDLESENCKPGCLMGKNKKLGIYIIPDNQRQGTLEQIILQCGDLVYSDYMSKSRNYINQYPEFQWKKPASREKATIAAVVSVLQPGLTNTVSFARDNWISKETLERVPDMVQLVQFLKELLRIED